MLLRFLWILLFFFVWMNVEFDVNVNLLNLLLYGDFLIGNL